MALKVTQISQITQIKKALFYESSYPEETPILFTDLPTLLAKRTSNLLSKPHPPIIGREA